MDYKRTTTASRREEQRERDRMIHVSAPVIPAHVGEDGVKVPAYVGRGTTYRKNKSLNG